jgi:UDP-N-acetylglucosamine transferase subunit ALG13
VIYGTVGTHDSDFGRFIQALDAIALSTGEQVIIQTGLSATLPRHAEFFTFKPRTEVLSLQRDARVIVCHAGVGSIIDALKAEKPLVVVPRLKCHGEHNNDHQLDIAQAVERRGWGKAVTDVAQLSEACANPLPPKRGYAPDKARLVQSVRAAILSGESR